MTDQVINGTEELVECLDILMAKVEFDQAMKEHREDEAALDDFYRDAANLHGTLHLGGSQPTDEATLLANMEWDQNSQLLEELEPQPDFEQVELQTALWQTAQLTMTLLFDHMRLIDYLKGQEDKENVSRIITPPGAEQALIVP